MTDIVDRLRSYAGSPLYGEVIAAAADEIERQRALVSQMHAQYRQWELDAFDKIERLSAEVKRLRNKVASLKGQIEEEEEAGR